jgi:uncharacterized membrane protein
MPMWGHGWSGPWGGFGWLFPFIGLIVMAVVMIACFRMMGRHAGPSASEIEDLRREIRELKEEIRQVRARP